MSRYIGFAEETTFGTKGTTVMDFRFLNETVGTTREDFFPETAEYWTPTSKVDGFFRGGGDIVIPVDPVQFPKLLVLHMGDPTTTGPDDSAYEHVFKYGGNESVSATGVKPFTLYKGVGIEKDRLFLGCLIENLTLDCVNREPVTATVSVIHSGHETLETARTPDYSAYDPPRFFSFAKVATMTIGGADRLSTAPTIEAFHGSLPRSYDTDHYVLGNPYLAAPSLSGFAIPTGSMDLSFTSEDEHERFLGSVGASETGDQSSFAIVLELQGALIGSSSKYGIKIEIPKAYYTGEGSVANVTGRDRIVQTVNWRGAYDSSEACSAKITVTNITDDYTSLS